MSVRVLLAAVAAVALLAPPGRADFLFSNRAVADYGTDNANVINFPYRVTQGFVLPQAGTPTAAEVGIWIPHRDGQAGLLSVTYRLGTTQEGDQLGTATVPATTSEYLYTNTRGYDIFRADFALPNTSTLSAGTTYYFTLLEAVSSGEFTFWDLGGNGQSLTLFGTPAAPTTSTPAPAGLALALAGLPLLAAARRFVPQTR